MNSENMSATSWQIVNKYIASLKECFEELDEGTKRDFWNFVGEKDSRLTGRSFQRPTGDLVDKCFQGKINEMKDQDEFLTTPKIVKI